MLRLISHYLIRSPAELNNNSCAEIELISLIEEQIPRYKLRADTITDFTGEFCFILAH